MTKARARRKGQPSLTPGQKGAITRRARARGIDPRRAQAAVLGWITRRRNQEAQARKHGQKARERTEKRLTSAQKAARTRDADRIERGESFGSGGGGGGSYASGSLDDYLDGYYDDPYGYEDYDVETSPDYGED